MRTIQLNGKVYHFRTQREIEAYWGDDMVGI